jgi:hypothetical protein
MNVWLIIKTVITLVTLALQMIRENKIKTGAYDEVLHAITKQFEVRRKAAEAAAQETPVDESLDPYNRTR